MGNKNKEKVLKAANNSVKTLGREEAKLQKLMSEVDKKLTDDQRQVFNLFGANINKIINIAKGGNFEQASKLHEQLKKQYGRKNNK